MPSLLAIAPTNAVVNYAITLPGAPSFVTATSTQLTVAAAGAVSGKYVFNVVLTDTISTLTSTIPVTLYAVEPCKYTVISTTPATLANMQFTINVDPANS